jgi:hypothetical protein
MLWSSSLLLASNVVALNQHPLTIGTWSLKGTSGNTPLKPRGPPSTSIVSSVADFSLHELQDGLGPIRLNVRGGTSFACSRMRIGVEGPVWRSHSRRCLNRTHASEYRPDSPKLSFDRSRTGVALVPRVSVRSIRAALWTSGKRSGSIQALWGRNRAAWVTHSYATTTCAVYEPADMNRA